MAHYTRWDAPPPNPEEQRRVQAEIEQIRRRVAAEAAAALDMAGQAGLLPYWGGRLSRRRDGESVPAPPH